jgi:hypothetical protein
MSIERTVSPSRVLIRSVWLIAVIQVIAVAACGPGTTGIGPTDSPTAATASPSIVAPSPSATAETGTPTWVSDIVGQLECVGPPASLGGEVPDSGAFSLGETPTEALASFLGPGNPYASLPTEGYSQIHEDVHWASFAHLVNGHPKVIIVLGDESELGSGWAILGLRACDASEFDPSVPLTFGVTIWTDAAGNRVPTTAIQSFNGPGHCGWDAALWLILPDAMYFRDPEGVMSQWTTTTFAIVESLPSAAVDSGYRSGESALWLDPGADAYLVLTDRIERWPRSTEPELGCA